MPGFDIIYLNYSGEINGWARYLIGFLSYLTDEYIVFALDDYLVTDYINRSQFDAALKEMGGNPGDEVVCIKLCNCSDEENEEYPITTQYCIWSRTYLIWLLSKVMTPWEFEINGSYIFKQYSRHDHVLHRPCLDYFTNSSISSRWEGVRFDGLREEDLVFLKSNNYV